MGHEEALKFFQGVFNTGVTRYADLWQDLHLFSMAGSLESVEHELWTAITM
jgi:hypothetical protein